MDWRGFGKNEFPFVLVLWVIFWACIVIVYNFMGRAKARLGGVLRVDLSLFLYLWLGFAFLNPLSLFLGFINL